MADLSQSSFLPGFPLSFGFAATAAAAAAAAAAASYGFSVARNTTGISRHGMGGFFLDPHSSLRVVNTVQQPLPRMPHFHKIGCTIVPLWTRSRSGVKAKPKWNQSSALFWFGFRLGPVGFPLRYE